MQWFHCLAITYFVHVISGAPTVQQNFINETKIQRTEDYRKKSFIINGWYATRTQFPYMVAIQRVEEATGSIFLCGGSLISQNYVLTAAHCIDGLHTSKFYLKIGAYDLSKQPEYGRYEIEVPFVNLKVHEGYNTETFVNDIGIIRLPEPVVLSSYIQLVSLPSTSIDDSYYEIRDGFVSGWGTFSAETSQQISPILKYTITDVIDSKKCNSYYNTYFNYFLNYGQFCAVYFSEGGHPCTGDSGGPLIDRYIYPPVQIGVVSLGGKTCNSYVPTIYTRVDAYLSWIGQNTDVRVW